MKNRILLFLLPFCQPLMSNVINIPSDILTIQAGINLARAGDTVLVAPGIYRENLSFPGAPITLASRYLISGDEKYIKETIIDGNDGSSVILVGKSSTIGTVITGFTIQNGDDGISAAGKFQFLHNRILDCTDGIDYESGGGGICKFNYFEGNKDDAIDLDGTIDILIEENILVNNRDDGIEIRLHKYSGETVFNIIRKNTISGNGEDGIQIIDYPDSSSRILIIEKNLITGNAMAGLGCMSDGNTSENYEGAPIPETILLFNNTIDGNNYGVTGGSNLVSVNNTITNCIHTAAKNVSGNSIIANCLFFGNHSDTLNCNTDAATTFFNNDPAYFPDYTLQGNSPCIDAGVSSFTWMNGQVLDIPSGEFYGEHPDIGASERQYPAALPKPSGSRDLILYPNPSHGTVSIDLPHGYPDGVYEIFSLQGKSLCKGKAGTRSVSIDLSRFPKGYYLVRITGDGLNFSKKLILQ